MRICSRRLTFRQTGISSSSSTQRSRATCSSSRTTFPSSKGVLESWEKRECKEAGRSIFCCCMGECTVCKKHGHNIWTPMKCSRAREESVFTFDLFLHSFRSSGEDACYWIYGKEHVPNSNGRLKFLLTGYEQLRCLETAYDRPPTAL